VSSRRLLKHLTRRAKSRARFGWYRSERIQLGTAALIATGALATVAGQYARMFQRRRARSDDGHGLVDQAPAAAFDTASVAVEGYAATPRSETVLLNLLTGFLGSFAFIRLSTFGIRSGWWPLGNTVVGGRHIHHFVPGILIAFASGTTALLTSSTKLEDRLAFPMGVGMGLTFDEAALLLDLRDVYWTRQGVLSVQVSFALMAMLTSSILTIRLLRRGEAEAEAHGVIPPAQPYLAPEA
jgi:hypothetical protein